MTKTVWSSTNTGHTRAATNQWFRVSTWSQFHRRGLRLTRQWRDPRSRFITRWKNRKS